MMFLKQIKFSCSYVQCVFLEGKRLVCSPPPSPSNNRTAHEIASCMLTLSFLVLHVSQ